MAKKAAPKAAEPKAAAASTEKKAQAANQGRDLREAGGVERPVEEADLDGLRPASSELIKNELGKKGPGLFVVPGLLKLKVVRKPATKAGQRLNPFTKQMMNVPAKPARNVVKALPLKSLKEMV